MLIKRIKDRKNSLQNIMINAMPFDKFVTFLPKQENTHTHTHTHTPPHTPTHTHTHHLVTNNFFRNLGL